MKPYGQKLRAWNYYWNGKSEVWYSEVDKNRARQENTDLIYEQFDEIQYNKEMDDWEELEAKYDPGDWTYQYYLEWLEKKWEFYS